MDLCVSHIDLNKTSDILSKGWNVLAINTKYVADKSGLKSIENNTISDKTLLCTPLSILNKHEYNTKNSLKILTRASVQILDGFIPGNIKKLNDYSILAIEATSQKTFQICCENVNADIITINFKESNPLWKVKRRLILAALKRGLCFEICLGKDGIFGNPNIIPQLNHLTRYIPLSKLIITSGYNSNNLIPLTTFIAHLAVTLDITHNEAKEMMNKSTRQCLYKAAARLTYQTGISAL